MNSRKNWFFACFVLAIIIHLRLNLQSTESFGLLNLLAYSLWTAVLIPPMLPVIFIEERLLHFAPWDGDGHWLVTMTALIGCSLVLWCFPVGRVERWFGTFDAFAKRRRPVIARGLALALDFVNRRLFGRQKTGGFA